MKKIQLKWLLAATALLTATTLTSSCDDDDDEIVTVNDSKEPKVQKDEKAGTFKVENISYAIGQEPLQVKAIEGDTLKITFIPESKFTDVQFSLDYDQLTQINDTLYVVKGLKDGTHEVTLKASYEHETDTLKEYYSATAKLNLEIPDTYIIIPYKLTISQDLLELVSPKVTHSADGNTLTYMVPDTDIVRPDSIHYEKFRDENGRAHLVEIGKETPEAGWTSEGLWTVPSSPYYRFNMRYYHTGLSVKVQVDYVPRENQVLTRERYFLSHKLDRESATYHIPNTYFIDNYNSWSITINIGGDDGIGKDEVSTALKELAKKPDVLNIMISQSGMIDTKNE